MRSALYNMLDKYFDRFAHIVGLFVCGFLALHAIALIASIALGLTLR